MHFSPATSEAMLRLVEQIVFFHVTHWHFLRCYVMLTLSACNWRGWTASHFYTAGIITPLFNVDGGKAREYLHDFRRIAGPPAEFDLLMAETMSSSEKCRPSIRLRVFQVYQQEKELVLKTSNCTD